MHASFFDIVAYSNSNVYMFVLKLLVILVFSFLQAQLLDIIYMME